MPAAGSIRHQPFQKHREFFKSTDSQATLTEIQCRYKAFCVALMQWHVWEIWTPSLSVIYLQKGFKRAYNKKVNPKEKKPGEELPKIEKMVPILNIKWKWRRSAKGHQNDLKCEKQSSELYQGHTPTRAPSQEQGQHRHSPWATGTQSAPSRPFPSQIKTYCSRWGCSGEEVRWWITPTAPSLLWVSNNHPH